MALYRYFLIAIVLQLIVVSVGIGNPVTLASPETEDATKEVEEEKHIEFTLDNLFDNDELFGKTAKDVEWSHDGRYLAFRWNEEETDGVDIWLFDSESGETKRLTKPQTFASFEADAFEIVQANKEEEDEEEKKKNDGLPKYAGVSSYTWSENDYRLMLLYKNDLYLLHVEKDEIQRLTKTKEEEQNYEFTKEGDGFVYWRGGTLIRMKFGDSFIEEIYPTIPSDQHIEHKILSPDQKWMAIATSKSKGESEDKRVVGYVTYQGRFAEWKTHYRPLAEDREGPDKEKWIYLQKVHDRIKNGTEDQAVKVFHHEGGEKHLRITKPKWSKDSSKIVFNTYNPDTEEIIIYTAKIDSEEEARQVLFSRNSGNQRSPNRVNPQFTPDGKYIIATFDDSGFRQPWLINPITQGRFPLVRGQFDADVLSFEEEGQKVFVLANKIHPVKWDVYAVDIETSEMTRLTQKDGEYSDATVSQDGDQYAALFESWEKPKELAVGQVSSSTERLITDSHSQTIDQLNQLKPEMFSYKNRHGHTIHGMIFLPPHLKKEDRRPIMIYTYGGPLDAKSMVTYGGFGTYNYRFPMYMAKRHGYIAAVIDPRGSSNYGEVFESANWKQPGEPQVEDLSDGVKHILETYGGDPNRVALYGWSFGGFVTQMALYTEPDRFTVGMAGAGPTQWRNYYGSYTSVTISEFEEEEDEDKKFSLIPLAKNLEGRLMLLHGVEDTNVLFQDTVKVYQALMKAGKGDHVELVVDTTGGHHMGGDFDYNYIFWLFEDFLLRSLGNGLYNLAEEGTAISSSSHKMYPAQFGHDSDALTRWMAEEEDEEPWWQIDLGTPHPLIGAEMYWSRDGVKYQYKLEGSSDAKEWDLLVDRTENEVTDQKQRLYFEEEDLRYLRVTLTEVPEEAKPSFYEFRAYRAEAPKRVTE